MAENIEKVTLNLICVDACDHSKRAMDWYLSTLHREGDDVGLVHVHCLPELPSFGLYEMFDYKPYNAESSFIAGGLLATDLYQEQIKESIQASKKIVEQYKKFLAEKEITAKIYCRSMIDSVGHTICEIAKESNATTIIMGQRGLGVIRRTFLGSTSDYVLHHAHIPVAVIPPNQ
ncbi:universal stress protein Slr1101-like isoform X1 [Clytia hemisphaerica]|uniref:universal stress protein Slr1101-like isoform X1 n=1 Tax=Clytia hemisphaerica TaxID=252671 RepID=UPI0034D64588